MDKRFFRRDQIWFVQKDKFGYSELVALSDFKVRSDASFEKDYLAGVYGGIPDFDEKNDVPSKYDPGTRVHELVIELKKYLD